MKKNYRVVFDNEAEATVEAKNERQAFYAAKKKLIKEFKNNPDEEYRKVWINSMANQYLDNAKVIAL